jgi:hypothetical protein
MVNLSELEIQTQNGLNLKDVCEGIKTVIRNNVSPTEKISS